MLQELRIASDEYLHEEIRSQQEILRTRRDLYTRAQEAIDPAVRVVVIVDEGIATGSSMLSAIRSVCAGHRFGGGSHAEEPAIEHDVSCKHL